MIQLFQTWALWGLAALSFPIAIHFLSRRAGKIIRMGSIRYLEETTTQKFKGIKLNEFVLLVLRCLLITALVLLLTEIVFTRDRKSDTRWLLLEKELENDERIKTLRDSVQKEGFEVRFLSKAFPLVENSEAEDSSSYYSLVERLEKEKINDCIVVSYNLAKRFQGRRRALPANIKWISLPPNPTQFTAATWYHHKDSISIREGYSNESLTYFETIKKKVNTKSDSSSLPPITIHWYAEKEFEDEDMILRAMCKAISDYSGINILLVPFDKQPLQDRKKSDFTFWLATTPLPADYMSKKTLRIQWKESASLVEQQTSTDWIITKRLHPALALKENLSLKIASLLLASEKVSTSVVNRSFQIIPTEIAWNQTTVQESEESHSGQQKADSYLLIVILVLIFVERSIAFNRKQ